MSLSASKVKAAHCSAHANVKAIDLQGYYVAMATDGYIDIKE